jgi:hypothetical protein
MGLAISLSPNGTHCTSLFTDFTKHLNAVAVPVRPQQKGGGKHQMGQLRFIRYASGALFVMIVRAGNKNRSQKEFAALGPCLCLPPRPLFDDWKSAAAPALAVPPALAETRNGGLSRCTPTRLPRLAGAGAARRSVSVYGFETRRAPPARRP